MFLSRSGPPGAARLGLARADSRGEPRLPPSHVCSTQKPLKHRILTAILAVSLLSGTAHAAPPGAVVSNQATLDYRNVANQPVTVASNIVEVTTAVVRSPANVDFTRVTPGAAGTWQETVGPSACFQGGAYVTLADPTLVGGSVIDPTQVQEVSVSAAYNLGEPAFIRLDDSDQNLDFQVIDYAVVTVSNPVSGDAETIRLAETGLDTGIFTGYVPTSGGAANPGDCALQGAPQSTVIVDYSDPADSTDTAQSTASFDPVQRVFESRTGSIVSGATIEIVDAATGVPAIVYGNDGVSQFPSAIVSGGTAVDSGGTSYVFGPGEFRFPVVRDGDYRLIVTPPPEYAAPSTTAPADLQGLPGAPYSLGPGSFGVAFTKSGDLSINFDIPVDPRAEALFLQKRTLTSVAAPGDFIRYEIELENASVSGTANNIDIIDELPVGVRFVAGSVKIDGADAPDPIISSDLRTLQFSINSLDVSESATVSYVVEVIGGKRNDELVNRATAFASGGLISNEASAAVRLREDLFRSTGTIIGRIVEGDCSQDSFTEEQGVEGIRIYLEDGKYAVSDEGGRFHFEGLKPGTHIAQLDTFTVPEWFDVIGCSDTPGFVGSAESQFVKLSQGSLLRADFYLRRKAAPEGRIDLELRSKSAGSADKVAYELAINGIGNVSIRNIDVMVMLPDGVDYEPGTMTIDGQNLGDPRELGGVLSLALPDQRNSWTSKVEFEANIEDHVSGELSTKSVARFETPMAKNQQTPVAETTMIREPGIVENAGYVLDLKFAVLSDELSAGDIAKLDRLIVDWQGVGDIQIFAVGHSDSDRIAARNRHLFADNYDLSRARANSAAAYIASALGVSADKLQVTGRGPDEPVADNATSAGKAKNRRVELVMSGVRPSQPSFLEVTKASSGTQVVETVGAVPGTELESDENDEPETPSVEPRPDVETLRPGAELLLPSKGFAPAIPAATVAVKHQPSQTVSAWVNGSPIRSVNFDGITVNAAQTVAVSTWKGVELDDGINEIRITVADADGKGQQVFTRTINYAGQPVRAEVVLEDSVLVADGKTQPIVAIRLYDRSGKYARPGMVGTFRIGAPYRSMFDVDNERRNDLVQVGERAATYRVGKNGIARIELAPTTRSGELKLHLNFENYREQELKAWLSPVARDWILVGFAEGTGAYNTLSKNIDAAQEAGNEDGYFDEGRVAFFAKGQVKGEFLLTVAYDTDRERSDTRNGFDTVIDPNRYYQLYADASEQRFEAPSQRKLYVKLERDQFYALFGDFDTNLSVTDLSRYERRFNGFLSEYRGERAGYTVFAADTNQSFRRDELRGDGTSGLYQLSSTPIIANSDLIRIEVRDRFDSGLVLETTELTRYLDYNLDNLNGTVYFKKPVPSRDLNFNPIYIVAEYESMTSASEDLIAGGRASMRKSDDSVELGVTHVNDDTQGAEADLTGVDLRWQVNPQTLFTAEIAETTRTVAGVETSGKAHSIELEHTGEKIDVRAFVREVEDEFGVGYQSAADSGVRRVGLDARGQIGERWFVEGEAAWQQVLVTEDIRKAAATRLRYERNSFSGSVGMSYAEDEFEDGDTRTSELAEIGLMQKFMGGKMKLRASASTEISGDAESLDFPTTLLFGADYRISKGVELVAEYEEASGRDIDVSMTRLGVRATPWAQAQIDSSLVQETTEFGPRLFANLGLVQGFQLNERWLFDIGLDQTNTLVDSTARQFDPDRELSSGSFNEDFLATHVGALYSADFWSANARVEYRNSDTEERTSLLFGWYREAVAGHGLSAGLTLFRNEAETGTELTSADLRLGWAYRLAGGQWSFLDRLDLVYDDLDGVSAQEESWRIINNFNANRRINAATQMSLQYAFKYVHSEFDANEFSGYTDLVGFDIRRGLSDKWDVGLNTSVYHSWESKVFDYSAGIDVGYNVATNLWVSLGYNLSGFHDEDFSQARYTAQGPFLRFSLKADQHTLKSIAGQR